MKHFQEKPPWQVLTSEGSHLSVRRLLYQGGVAEVVCLHDGRVQRGEIQGGDRDIIVAVRVGAFVCEMQ